MGWRRLRTDLVIPASLLLLVVVLGVLQYRWLDQASRAERDRLGESIRARAQSLADGFDAELLWIHFALQSAAADGTDRPGVVARALATWRQGTAYPQIITGLYLIDVSPDRDRVREYREANAAFADIDYPAALSSLRRTLTAARSHRTAEGGDLLMPLANRVDASIPALFIALPAASPSAPDAANARRPGVRPLLVVLLDPTAIRTSLLPSLVAQHLPTADGALRVTVVDAADRRRILFTQSTSADAGSNLSGAVAEVPLGSARIELGPRVIPRLGLQATGASGPATLSLSWYGRQAVGPSGEEGPQASPVAEGTPPVARRRHITVGGNVAPAWRLLVHHPRGTLDAAVAGVRRRNLLVSFGILSVLAAGMGLVVRNARQARRLAAQQLDFVATVSHELRTPLAVIRSAAQNLASGVVQDIDRARSYGQIIGDHGRRLGDTIEQVIEYAGLSGRGRQASSAPVDVAALIETVVRDMAPALEGAGIALDLAIAAPMPYVEGDAPALRRLLHNLLENAAKHGGEGRWIGVDARATASPGDGQVLITVADRGAGVDPADVPHLFEPFYRGRAAVARQIPGNGIGLSLCRRIVEAHGGRISVRSRAGHGSTFSVQLPARRAAADHLAAPGHSHARS